MGGVVVLEIHDSWGSFKTDVSLGSSMQRQVNHYLRICDECSCHWPFMKDDIMRTVEKEHIEDMGGI